MATSVLTGGLVRLAASIYPQTCIAKAIEAYREFADVGLLAGEEGEHLLTLAVRPPHLAQEPTLRREFLNYLLDLALQDHLAVQ